MSHCFPFNRRLYRPCKQRDVIPQQGAKEASLSTPREVANFFQPERKQASQMRSRLRPQVPRSSTASQEEYPLMTSQLEEQGYRLCPECFDSKVNRTNPTPLRMAPNVAQRLPG